MKKANVKNASVPQVEGLTIKNILDWCTEKSPDVLKYLPSEEQWHHQDREWICNIVFTLDPVGFQ